MFYFVCIVVLVLSYLLGAVGFPQIIGSLQSIGYRSGKLIAFTTIFWLVIIIFATLAVYKFLPNYKIMYFIGMGITLLQTLTAGKIE